MSTLRQDLFTVVHKAIRALLYDIGADLQRCEFSATGTAGALLDRLDTTLAMIREHADHENRFIFPEVRRFQPALVDDLEAEHLAVEALAGAVDSAASALRAAGDALTATPAAQALNTRFNVFLAAYLAHMNREEREMLPATWKHFSDAEIGVMRTRIQRDTDPARYTEWLRWMFTSQTESELVTLFSGVKVSAPPVILGQMTDVARATLGDPRWSALSERAGL